MGVRMDPHSVLGVPPHADSETVARAYRELAKRLHQLAQRDAQGFSIIYAGEWRA